MPQMLCVLSVPGCAGRQDVVFSAAYSGARAPYSPAAFLYAWWRHAEHHLAGYQQQDAHEFYLYALAGLAHSRLPAPAPQTLGLGAGAGPGAGSGPAPAPRAAAPAAAPAAAVLPNGPARDAAVAAPAAGRLAAAAGQAFAQRGGSASPPDLAACRAALGPAPHPNSPGPLPRSPVLSALQLAASGALTGKNPVLRPGPTPGLNPGLGAWPSAPAGASAGGPAGGLGTVGRADADGGVDCCVVPLGAAGAPAAQNGRVMPGWAPSGWAHHGACLFAWHDRLWAVAV